MAEKVKLVDLGTVLSIVGKKGILRFNDRNLARENKQIVVKLVPKKGAIVECCCSKAITDMLRAKEIGLGDLVNYQLLEDQEGVKWISVEQGEDVDVEVDSLDIRDIKAKKKFEMEDYIAY